MSRTATGSATPYLNMLAKWVQMPGRATSDSDAKDRRKLVKLLIPQGRRYLQTSSIQRETSVGSLENIPTSWSAARSTGELPESHPSSMARYGPGRPSRG